MGNGAAVLLEETVVTSSIESADKEKDRKRDALVNIEGKNKDLKDNNTRKKTKTLSDLSTVEENNLINALCIIYKQDMDRCEQIIRTVQAKAKEDLKSKERDANEDSPSQQQEQQQQQKSRKTQKLSEDKDHNKIDNEQRVLSHIESIRVPELKESSDIFYFKLLILHNHIRSFPQSFIPYLEKHYLKRFICDDKGRHLLPIEGKSNSFQQYQEGPSVVKETIQFLQKVQPALPLAFDNCGQEIPSGFDKNYIDEFLSKFLNDPKNGKSKIKKEITIPIKKGLSGQRYLYQSSWDHVSDCGKKGLYGHNGSDGSSPKERIERYCDWEGSIGENIGYGTGIDTDTHVGNIIFGLLIDDGVPNRGHRIAMFNPDYHVVGIFSGNHASHGTMTVLNYATNVGPKVKKLKVPKKLTNIQTLTSDVQEVVQSIKSPKARNQIVRALEIDTRKEIEGNPQSDQVSDGDDSQDLKVFQYHKKLKSLDIDYNPKGKAEITFWYTDGEGQILTTTWDP